jgi:hypothetical protein
MKGYRIVMLAFEITILGGAETAYAGPIQYSFTNHRCRRRTWDVRGRNQR